MPRTCPSLVFLTCGCGILSGCSGWEIFQSEDTHWGPDPYSLSILNAESCPLPPDLDPKEVSLVSFNVRLVGHHFNGVPANYFYASLLTTDGARYLADYPGCEPLLSGAPVRPGEAAEGYLNFPIPPGKTPDKLVYAPTLTGKTEGQPVVELQLNQRPKEEADTP